MLNKVNGGISVKGMDFPVDHRFIGERTLPFRQRHERPPDQPLLCRGSDLPARLIDVRHGYTSDNTDDTPTLGTLRAAVASSDQWYLDYLRGVSPKNLAEAIPLTFRDGNKGHMTREERLTHAALHGRISRRRGGGGYSGKLDHPALGHLRRLSSPDRAGAATAGITQSVPA